MINWSLRRVGLCNVAPGGIATGMLWTGPGEECTQIMICGPSPDLVDTVELKWRNLPLVHVPSYRDCETGQLVTGGRSLANRNGLAGLHLCGGEFSILFDHIDGPGGRGLIFKAEDHPVLHLTFSQRLSVSARVDVVMLLRSGE